MAKRQDLGRTIITDHPEAVGYAHPTHSSQEVDPAEAARTALDEQASNIADWEEFYEPSLYELVGGSDPDPSPEPRDCKIGFCNSFDCLTCRDFCIAR